MECCWTLILSVFACIVGVYYLIYRNVDYFKKKGVPYAKPTPLFGNLGPNALGKLSLAENLQRLYNIQPHVKYLGIFDFMAPTVMLRDPELIKSIAIKNFDNFRDHEEFVNRELDPLFGNNLLSLQGDQWRDTRNLLSPAFTSSKMKMMYKLVLQCGIKLGNYLTANTSEPVEMEMKDTFTRYTNDVITTSAFGISVNSLKDRENEFYLMGREALNFTGIQNMKLMLFRFSPFLSRLFNIRIVSEKVNKFFNHVIGSTVAMRDEKGIVRNDMIQLMMQARNTSESINLTIEDMAAHAFIFYFGGADSSSTLMSFAAHEIGVNPDIQKKLQTEIDQVLADGQGEVTYEALHGMRYLDAVISETLRLYPPFPALDRVCTKAFKLPPAAPGFNPFTIEVGTSIWLPSHGLHRDPKYFPDPERFDPDRFSEENRGKILPCTYFPFGLGPRSCIANRFALMQAKLAIFHLLSKCNLSPCSKTSVPMKFDRQSFSTSPENGFWLTIQRRS